MRAHDRSLGDFSLYVNVRCSSRSLSQPPLRRAIILGLHRPKQGYDFTRSIERGLHQMLVGEALIRDPTRSPQLREHHHDGGAVAKDFSDALHHFGRIVANPDNRIRAELLRVLEDSANASARAFSHRSVRSVMLPPASVWNAAPIVPNTERDRTVTPLRTWWSDIRRGSIP